MTTNLRLSAEDIHELTAKLASEGWDRMRGLRLLHTLKQADNLCTQMNWQEATGRIVELTALLEEFIREAPGHEKLKNTLRTANHLAELLKNGRMAVEIDLNSLPEHPETWKFVLAGGIEAGVEELAETLKSIGFLMEHAATVENVVEACRSGRVILLATVSWLGENVGQITELLPATTPPVAPMLVAFSDTDNFRIQVKVRQAGARLFLDYPIDTSRLITALAGLAWIPRVPYRVLVVDDSISMLNLNASILQAAGFKVLAIDDPVAARDLLEEFAPEACLLDVEMPACQGTDLAALLRRNKRYAHLPVIYLSAFSDIEHQLDARNAGGEDYLVKPVDPRLLVTSVMARVRQFRTFEGIYFQRRKTWRQLQNLKGALDAHALISVASSDGSILDVNSKFCNISGYSRDELLGHNHRIIKSGHHSQTVFEGMWTTIAAGRVWRGELQNRCKNGSIYWVQSTIVPILNEQGLPEQYVSIRTDITEQKAVQAEREQQVRLLKLLQHALQQFIANQDIMACSRLLLDAMLLLTESAYGFIGEVLHDQNGKPYLKSHAISDISRDDNSQRLHDQTQAAGMEFRGLDNLFGTVLSTGKTIIANDVANDPSSGELPEGHPPLNALLGVPIYHGGVMTGMAGLANRPGGYDVKTVASLDNVTTIYAGMLEAIRLRSYQQQVIGEIQQAREASLSSLRANSTILSCWETEMRTPLNGLLGQAQILQLNASLDEDAQAQVCEILKNGRDFTQLIENLIDRLDTKRPGDPFPSCAMPPMKKYLQQNGRKLILVAEDNPANQAVLNMQLDLLGYEADIATDGAVALAKWKLGGHDLILTDLNMPGMNGMELARAIRATERESGAYVPVIAITALNHPEDIALCLHSGMDDALPKPIELDKLQLMLERWLPQSSPVIRVVAEDVTTRAATAEATLDLHYLTRIVGNINIKQIRELIDLFTATVRADLPACRLHLSEKNGRALALIMHKLKSSARMVGALRFASHAEKLEHTAKAEQIENAKAMCSELENALHDIEEAANQLHLSSPAFNSPKTLSSTKVSLYRHILIVDDDAVARRQLSMLLSVLGVNEVESIDNAEQALLLIAQQDDIDLVISDLNMPGVDGIEFLRRLADSGYQQSIILVSGVEELLLQTAAEVVRAKGMNLRGTLRKPVMRDELLALLTQHFEPKKPTQPPRSIITVSPEEILAGIHNNEFEVHFQPKVDAATLRVVGVESLARWQHNGKSIPPDVFIITAEQHDLIGPLSEVLVTKALVGGARLAEAGFHLSVAVNLSANWLSDIHLPEFIVASIEATGFKAENLILEITETGIMADIVTAMDVMTRLRLKGFKLSIDDFGTGYSSLEQLQRIPFSELKLDRSFVQGAVEKSSARAILASTIEMARKLKLSTVAEGVETQADLDLVRGLGCDLVQGWFIAKAMPVAQLIEWLHAKQ